MNTGVHVSLSILVTLVCMPSSGIARLYDAFELWCWRRDRLPNPVFLGFPCGSAGKESACNVGDLGLTPGLGRSPGEVKGYLLLCSGVENSMHCIAHGVAKSRTRLSELHFHFQYFMCYWQGQSPW